MPAEWDRVSYYGNEIILEPDNGEIGKTLGMYYMPLKISLDR